MDAVVTAGGRISGEFAERAGVTVKALIEIGGRPVIQTVIEALRGTPGVDRVFVVGPEELTHSAATAGADEVILEAPDGATNFLMGLKRSSGSRAVFAASDLPFLNAQALQTFLEMCPPDADFCYPILRKDRFLAAYPGMSSTFAPLRDGKYTGGCAFLLNPQALLANQKMIERVFDSRKSIFKLASILGWTFCIRLLTRTADVESCARRGSQLIGCNCRVVDNCPPELTCDLDDLSDYEYAMCHAEKDHAKNPSKRDLFHITIFNLAPSFFWAAMLLVILQKRIEVFVPTHALPRSMSIIVGAGGAVSIITQIVVGAISDRHRGRYGRRKPFVFIGTLLSIPAIWLFALAGNFLMLVAAFVLLQLFTNIAQGPYQALIPDTVPPERHGIASAYMGIWLLVGQAGGLIITAVLFSGLVGKNGLVYLFCIFTALFVGLMLVTVLHVREQPYTGEQVLKRQAVLAIFSTDLRHNPSFVWALVSRFLINLGFYTATLYLIWYVQFALGISKDKAPLYTLILGLVVTGTGLLGTFPAGRMADAISKKSVIYGSCLLCILASIVFCIAGNIWWAMGAAAIFGLGMGAFAAVDWALACNVLPEGDAAKFLGIWSLSFVFPQMAAAFVGDATVAAFAGRLGQAAAYRAVLAAIVPFMALGTLAVHRVKEKPVRIGDAVDG